MIVIYKNLQVYMFIFEAWHVAKGWKVVFTLIAKQNV